MIKYAEKLQESPDMKEFRCQVLLEGLEIGEYCAGFDAVKMERKDITNTDYLGGE